jgi:flavin-dependent dehydrogenase
MVAGADGVHSVVRQHLADDVQPSDRHFCLGIRSYFRNVTGMADQNFIELMFLKPLLPGYFWIFPGAGGVANVGLGIPRNLVIKKKIKLISLFRQLISEHPALKDRFSRAEMLGRPEAHTLPLATYNCRRYGDRYILLGDAGFLVDPFSGEGIGNAMGSAESAVPVILDSFKKGDFSQAQLSGYQRRIANRFGNEFRIMGIMQNLVHYPALMNLVVRKAARNEELRMMLSSMFTQQDIRSKLTRPGFYLELLMK